MMHTTSTDRTTQTYIINKFQKEGKEMMEDLRPWFENDGEKIIGKITKGHKVKRKHLMKGAV